MRLSDFEALVRRQASEIPAEFLDGIAEVVVSPRTVVHPTREGVWTLGECVPLPGADNDPRHLQTRVVLYHGSFQALSRESEEFDWVEEAWETLTHEVRHHVEWKARAPDLEDFDRAAEENFARHDGDAFDPVFYRDGVRLPDGAFQVDDDIFMEQEVAELPAELGFVWKGESYAVAIPKEISLPAFLTILDIDDPPPGELVLVLRRRAGIRDLFRRGQVFQAELEARGPIR